MKKLFGFFAIIILFTGCFSAPVAWDSSLSEEEMTTVAFSADIAVVSYNGISVSNWKHVKIPGGNTDITCNISGRSHSARNKQFSYRFENGKHYLVSFGLNSGYWGVYIYDYDEWNAAKFSAQPIEFVVFQ